MSDHFHNHTMIPVCDRYVNLTRTGSNHFSFILLTDGYISSGSHWAWWASEDHNWLWIRPKVVSGQSHYSRIWRCCRRIRIYPVSSIIICSICLDKFHGNTYNLTLFIKKFMMKCYVINSNYFNYIILFRKCNFILKAAIKGNKYCMSTSCFKLSN